MSMHSGSGIPKRCMLLKLKLDLKICDNFDKVWNWTDWAVGELGSQENGALVSNQKGGQHSTTYV